jgi:hypothetical protein
MDQFAWTEQVTTHALPTQAGDCTQFKLVGPDQSTPRRVFFDMHLCPVR